MRKFTRLLLLTYILFFFSCETDDLSTDTQATIQDNKIIEAKKWLDDYKTKVAIDPMFKDVNYHWEVASKVIQKDGTELIKLPLTENTENENYKGEKMLYLSQSNEGYNAVIHELFPDQKKNTKEDVFANLDAFNGYVINWNLSKGFINGSKFIDGKAVQAIKVKVLSDKKDKTHSITGKEAPIPLDEVLVSGSGTQPLSISRDFSTGSSVAPSGSGGGSSIAPAGAGGRTTTLSAAEQAFLNDMKNTSPTAFESQLILSNAKEALLKTSFYITPVTGINVNVVQNIGNPYTIKDVQTSIWGVTLINTWNQTLYTQNTVKNITTLTIVGTFTFGSGIQGVGTVYSTQISFQVKIDNKTGKLISGTRL